jgi:hypothetical protein
MRYFVIVALIVGGVIFLRQQTTQKAEAPKKQPKWQLSRR